MSEVSVHDHAGVTHGHGAEEHGHHGSQWKLYWGIAVVLAVATVIEVLLSEYLKELGVDVALVAGSMMSIAIVKALLVILFYMHLKYEKPFLSVIFLIPFALVSLLALALFAQP